MAAITPGSIAVSSYAHPVIDGVTSATLYAGFADSGGNCTTGNGTDACNSCDKITTALCDITAGLACNTTNVYGSLALVITFSVNDASKVTTGTSTIRALKDSSSLDSFIETVGTTATAGIAANTTLTATILWSNIFAKLSNSTSTTSFKSAFKIGVAKDGTTLTSTDEQFTVNINYRYIDSAAVAAADPASRHTICPVSVPGGSEASLNEGVCGFNIKAGDSKVFVKDVYLPVSTWPNPSDFATAGVPFTGSRFFYAQTDATSNKFCGINLSTAGTADLLINSDSSLPINKIFNLENDKQYAFWVATVDKAGNVTRFSSQAYLDGETVFKHSATPSKVVGLLDGKKCFVATAAFGSEMAPQVEWIRQFRNHFLLPHGWGRSFVRWYYQNSPPVADYIAQHEGLRTLARTALWPIVVISSLTVSYGLVPTFFVLLTLIAGFTFLIRRVRGSRQRNLQRHS